MQSRNRSLLFSFFFTLLVAFAVVYTVSKMNLSTKTPVPSSLTPENIKKFRWLVGEISYEFEQMSPGAWSSTMPQDRINTKIQFLSNLKTSNAVTEAPPDTSELVTVELDLSDGTKWRGNYYEDVFFWTEGPLANTGIELSSEEIVHFQEGRYAFDSLSWSLCNEPIKGLYYELNEEGLELVKKGTSWSLTSLDGNSRKLKSSQVDGWLKQLCSAKIVAWLDLDNEPFGLDDGTLTLTYVSGKKIEYQISGSSLQIKDNLAALSPELVEHLEGLLVRLESE